MRISDWSSDVCSSGLIGPDLLGECANPVARCDHRAGHAAETLLDITPLRGLRRMQQVPALDLATIARQFGETRHAPDIAGHAPFLLEQISGGDPLEQHAACAEQLPMRLFGLVFRTQQIHTTTAAPLDTSGPPGS